MVKKIIHFLFCDYDKWQDIELYVKLRSRLEGSQSAQIKYCKICNKKQVRDVR